MFHQAAFAECMQTFRDSGGVYQVALAYLTRYVTIQCFQLDSPLHGTDNHHLITVAT